MPDILLRITATNTASAAIEQAARSITGLDSALASVGANSARIQSALNSVNTAAARQASALNAAAVATDNYARLQARLAAATGDTSRLEDQVARARLQSVTATDRAAESTVKLANAQATLNQRQQQAAATAADPRINASTGGVRGGSYGPPAPGYLSLADPYSSYNPQARAAQSYADQVIARNQRTLAGLNGSPTVVAEPAPSSDRAGSRLAGEIGGALSNYAIYGGLYAAGSLVTSSIGRSGQYSTLQGTTSANTGLDAAQTADLSGRITALAGSGGMPYDQTTLLQGAYSLASLGVGQQAASPSEAIFQVAQIAAQMSAASGAPDTSQATDAITSVLADYRLNTPRVVPNAQRVADQLQVGAKLGKAELPDFAAQIAIPAALGSQLGIDSGQVIAYLAAESAGGLASGELGQDLYALLRSTISVRTRNQQGRVAAALGLTDFNSSFFQRHGLAGGAQLIQQREAAQGLTPQQAETVNARLFGNEAASKGLAAALAGGLYAFTPQVENSQGAVQAAYTTSQSYAGAQLKGAEVQFGTALDSLTKTTLPAFVLAVQGATTVLKDAADLFAGPGGKGGIGASVSAATQVLNRTLDPTDPAFGNLGKARQEVANQIKGGQGGGGLFDTDPRVTSFLGGVWGAITATPGSIVRGFTQGTGAANAVGAYAGAGEDYGYSQIRPAPVSAARRTLSAEDIRNATLEGMTRAAPAVAQAANGYRYAGPLGDQSPAYQAALTLSRGGGTGRAASRAVRFIDAPGIGALEAGAGSTAVRFAGQVDPEAQEIRTLRQELQAANRTIATYEGEVVRLLGVIAGQGGVRGRGPDRLTASGGGRGYKGA